ncbi:sodium/proline symporter PutP [Kangiella sp. TOML190]|uniref:sodium/proline symporter PutP n=1 Tax=Kangiella sp. TOML190 TaxID=2931351 RepID=UPI00203B1F83|nr:sodium/proline symporter PutP [Kangiella sp. TOML190]
MPTATLITFAAYLLFMMLIGVWAYRRTNNLSDYILGGRSLGSGVTALSAAASDMSGWILMGLPGALYAGGIKEGWIAVGLVIGAYLNWKLVAGRLRSYTEIADNSLTLPDYFENRFHDRSKVLRVSSALVILVFYTFYTASGMVAGATLFENSFQMDYQQALIIGAAVIVAYTFLGGFLAVSWTDFFQGILMATALVVAPITMIIEYNGLAPLFNQVEAVKPNAMDWTAGLTLIGFLSLQAWGLGYFGQPHILARFMAAESVATIPAARRIAMSWMIISLLGSMFIGLAGIAYFSDDPNSLALLAENPERIFILINKALFNPWLAGFLLAAILAAVMSTIDSQLLVSSSSLTEDFYKSLFRPKASETELVWISRFGVVLIALIAVLIALDPKSRVLELVSYAWAGFGAAFGPVVIFSLLWQKMTRWGALAGMLVGAITVLIWKQLSAKEQGLAIFDLYEILPGFVFASIAIVLVSKLTRVEEQTLNQFDWFRSQFKKMVS